MKRWLSFIEAGVLTMAGLRFVSATIEFTAALLMLHFNDVKKAVAINAALAVVGPIIFILTMAIGLFSMAEDLSFRKLLFIGSGVTLIFYGIYR